MKIQALSLRIGRPVDTSTLRWALGRASIRLIASGLFPRTASVVGDYCRREARGEVTSAHLFALTLQARRLARMARTNPRVVRDATTVALCSLALLRMRRAEAA